MNQRGNPNWTKGGPSPNPGGRPKKKTEVLQLLADERASSQYGEVRRERVWWLKLDELAREGNLAAIKYLIDQKYGKATEKVEHAGEDGEPIKIQHVFGRNGHSSVEPEVSPDFN